MHDRVQAIWQHTLLISTTKNRKTLTFKASDICQQLLLNRGVPLLLR